MGLVCLALCACPAPPRLPSLDDELEAYRALRNESIEVSCACPSLVVYSEETFESEEQCLDELPRVTENGLECMKETLAILFDVEAEGAALIACYNMVMADYVGCERDNIEMCDAWAANQCGESRNRAFEECDPSLSAQEKETLFLCAFE